MPRAPALPGTRCRSKVEPRAVPATRGCQAIPAWQLGLAASSGAQRAAADRDRDGMRETTGGR
eukprot:4017302-Pyramimonas_sp.AAC.1